MDRGREKGGREGSSAPESGKIVKYESGKIVKYVQLLFIALPSLHCVSEPAQGPGLWPPFVSQVGLQWQHFPLQISLTCVPATGLQALMSACRPQSGDEQKRKGWQLTKVVAL